MKAILRNARISPKKMNLVAGLVRGKKAQDALAQLKFTPKKGAEILYKVISSAIANATNNFKQRKEGLYIKSILVTKGMTYKRGIPVSRGRYHPILKRNTHITVEVGMEEPKEEVAKKSAKAAPKAEAKKEVTPKKGPAKKETTAKKEAPKKASAKKELSDEASKEAKTDESSEAPEGAKGEETPKKD
jgi:large subunit ribosomal protein L22